MSQLRFAAWDTLYSREDRLIARIAGMAYSDTWEGSARALVLAKKLKAMGGTDLEYVVSAVYSASSGRHSPIYEGWRCPECGCPYLGQDAAYQCCTNNDDE